MLYISEVSNQAPEKFVSDLQKTVYQALAQLKIPFERVDTDEAISMEDCVLINEKLNMEMVKTLFLCNSKKTLFYLFITTGEKAFETKKFCDALNISRVSFVPKDLFEELLEVKIGAATVFSVLHDLDKTIQVVFDNDVVTKQYYGCSDGTNTGYMKLETDSILTALLPYSKHKFKVINYES
jgi:Uncharacterized conserved protein